MADTSELKIELHSHAMGDPEDNIKHTAEELIDKCSEYGYNVLAITLHHKVIEGKRFKELKDYAEKRNILLLNGCEISINKKHILVYNITEKERASIKTFDDLRRWKISASKKRNVLIIAPHPFYNTPIFQSSLGDDLIENIGIFDAIEHSVFYNRFFNLNRRAISVAKKYNKPLIALGDIHILSQLNKNYTIIRINREKNVNNTKISWDSICSAIKNGNSNKNLKRNSNQNLRIVTRPLTIFETLKIVYKVYETGFSRLFRKKPEK